MFSQVRVFNFMTGKITKVIDESLQQYTELQQVCLQLSPRCSVLDISSETWRSTIDSQFLGFRYTGPMVSVLHM